ncbi:hypothetical protein QF042_002031 [Pedobacter sp. W3I1]|nr:hypothetical protein [Pedobacter sp. W3I1]
MGYYFISVLLDIATFRSLLTNLAIKGDLINLMFLKLPDQIAG